MDGGPAGIIYGFFPSFLGTLILGLVNAEMASMIPLAGGPFNWVAILSPDWCKKYLSYTAGWMTVIAYQIYVAAICYTNAKMIQGLIILNHPSYVPHLWHATLLFYAIIAWATFANTTLGRLLPRIEALLLILYILGFFGVLIPMAYLAPHTSAENVFRKTQNMGGWDTVGLSVFVSWFTTLGSFIGHDGADHVGQSLSSAILERLF